MERRARSALRFLRKTCHGRSMIIETALPPPRQSVARPRFAPRSFIAKAKVVRIRAPLQPIGWPRATAPPFTLNFSCGIPSSRITPRLAAAYASLCSKRSISSTDRPVFFSSFRTPGIGAAIAQLGRVPRGHLTPLAENRRELRELLEGGVTPDSLVDLDAAGTGHIDGDNLLLEPTLLGCGGRPSMTLQCEAIHVLSADLESFRDDLARDAHVELIVGIP